MQALVALALMKLYGDGVQADVQGASELLDRSALYSLRRSAVLQYAGGPCSERDAVCACICHLMSRASSHARRDAVRARVCPHSAAAQGGAPLAAAAARLCVWLQRTGWASGATVRRVSELVSAVAGACGRLASMGGESGSPMMAAVRVAFGRVLWMALWWYHKVRTTLPRELV